MGASSQVSRRDIFRLAGVAGLAAAVRPTLGAEASTTQAAGSGQGAGFYRRAIGKYEVTVVSDGVLTFKPPRNVIGANASEEAVNAALTQAFLPTDHLNAQVNTLLIRADDRVILVDTGCGATYGPAAGKLLGNLANAGVKPEQITDVVLTHLHGDHAEGLFSTEGKPVFPNARVMVHQAEVEFWKAESPDFSKSGVAEAYRPVMAKRAKQVLTFAGERLKVISGQRTEIAPGVTAIHVPGHTPGHLLLTVESDGQTFLYITDLSHSQALTFPHPEWYVAFDTNRDQAVKARQDWYAKLADERTLISGSHLPFPAFGHVQQSGENFRYVPVDWEW